MNRLASPSNNTLPSPALDPQVDYLADNQHTDSVSWDSVGWNSVGWNSTGRDAPSLKSNPSTASDDAPVASFAPVHYERRYSYPLLVWLHGQSGHESQLHQMMPLISMRNYIAVAPRGTIETSQSQSNELEEGFGWSQSASEINRAEDRVFQAIEYAKQRFNIHSNRVFVGGYGSGGTMAIRMAWNHPAEFGGAISLSGPIPKNDRPLRNANHLRTLPLLLASGREAKKYTETNVCHDLRLLHTAGMQVALRQYPCGDELRTSMLADVDRWMMDIICGNGATAQA